MNTLGRRAGIDQILVDLNTQCDFLLPGGALPVANRAEVLPNVRHLMNWARIKRVPVISSLEAHRHGESTRGMPPHCIDRTLGQRKLPFTLMPQRIVLQGDNTSDVPTEPFRKYQQIIFTKRNADFLANPKADRLINATQSNAWILIGVTATHCVKAVALGLLARHQRVIVVKDACGYWSMIDGEHAIRQMEAKGAIVVTTDDVISGAVTRRIDELILDEAARLAEIAAAAGAREKVNAEPPEANLESPARPISPYTQTNGGIPQIRKSENGKSNGTNGHGVNGHAPNGSSVAKSANGRTHKAEKIPADLKPEPLPVSRPKPQPKKAGRKPR